MGSSRDTRLPFASIEAAAARGTMAFRRQTSVKPLQAAIEAVTEAVSTEDLSEKIAALKEALAGSSEAVERPSP